MAVGADPLRLEAFAVTDDPPRLVPAPSDRDWLGAGGDVHYKRCTPLVIGNSFGWQATCPARLAIAWNGGEGLSDLAVRCERANVATSNFAHGICTVEFPYIFRLPPGIAIMVTGPTSTPKDGVAWLTGVTEADWCRERDGKVVEGFVYTFTINLRLTRPGVVVFEEGEPIAQIFPVVPSLVADAEPVLRRLSDDPGLLAEHQAWVARRVENRAALARGDEAARKQPWIRCYTQGRYASDNAPTTSRHMTKLNPPPFVDLRVAAR